MKRLFSKGHRVRNKDKLIPYWLATIVALPFLLLIGVVGFGLFVSLPNQWIIIGIVIFVLVLISAIVVYRLYLMLLSKNKFFIRRYREFLLWRFLFQNGFYFTKDSKGKPTNGKPKINFPKVYLKQEKYMLSASFQLEGIKFQERFLSIGGQLETMFSADMMGSVDDKAFITYNYAIDSIRGRIFANDVTATIAEGVKLSEGVYWDFVHDPHLLIAGGTGGGKTVFLRSLLVALLRLGRVEILDPKQADFVSLKDLNVLKGRVTWETEEMAQRLIDLNHQMDERYELMRKISNERKEKELGAFYKYDLKPLFIMIDEFPSLVSAVEDLPMNDSVNYMEFMSALKQLDLKGRQAGFYLIIATQNVKSDDLPSTIKDNMMLRITLGRVSSFTYATLFGEENKDKKFKYVEKIGANRIFGRGYYGIFGGPAKEFFAPLLPDSKDFDFYTDFESLPRIEDEKNQFPAEVVEEKRYLQAEVLEKLEITRSTLKKIESLLKENMYPLEGNGYSEKELDVFRKILAEREETQHTLRDSVSDVVSTLD
ncbi:cell division protein FtsK [Lactococcus lactis]|uniref:FtsK/SpoIIIE domain-containing protein n=1 Tax=Lactococcus lactis TaxID=1358 RepID=UPI001455FEC7|nr:FtsK/SpoIIIE domain-containing protein [Lactococcus lactis]MCT0437954.1 cell division protein FtsK [Lactococcus lactis subsp. lactis]MCT2920878.1 cell division protein FtsK [Lactococcus lactis]NLS47977.1 cell division protein FtsK [Lactococcus lactis]